MMLSRRRNLPRRHPSGNHFEGVCCKVRTSACVDSLEYLINTYMLSLGVAAAGRHSDSALPMP